MDTGAIAAAAAALFAAQQAAAAAAAGKKRKRRDVLRDFHSISSLIDSEGSLPEFIEFFNTGRTFHSVDRLRRWILTKLMLSTLT